MTIGILVKKSEFSFVLKTKVVIMTKPTVQRDFLFSSVHRSFPRPCVTYRNMLVVYEKGRDISVGIGTRYGLGGPRMESR